MKSLNQYIKEKLIINKDYVDNMIVVKSFDELRKIIEDRYDKLGPGTEQKPIDFNDIDVSNLDSFYDKNAGKFGKGLFENIQFKYIDISDWDVSNVKSTLNMFNGCVKLESVGNISKWDVSNVTDMRFMFRGCKKFNHDLSKWNVSKVTNIQYMFAGCHSFNQDLSNWNVSKVRYRTGIFDGCPIKNEYKPKFK